MKKNKTWIFLILIIPILLIANSTQKVKADSGFDTSYDSGSSSSSSSSWSSSSSSSSSRYSSSDSWSSSSSSSSSGSGEMTVFDWIIVIVMFVGIPSIIARGIIKDERAKHHPLKSLSDDEIRKYIPNFDRNKFITDRFNDYVQIQNAWMNFDYNTLRSKLTDELYNQYAMQLDTMKIKNEQNIMSSFKHKETAITEIYEENGELVVTINSVITFYDFIVQNGRVVRGNSTKKITSLYEMKFVCNKDAMSNKCPSCHAPLNNNSSQVCEYCGSVITRTGENWVMTKKQTKNQW